MDMIMKQLFNEICMYMSFAIIGLGIIVYVVNHKTPVKHRFSNTASYTDGKECVINMNFNRDSYYISKDMSECLKLHAYAINAILKDY